VGAVQGVKNMELYHHISYEFDERCTPICWTTSFVRVQYRGWSWVGAARGSKLFYLCSIDIFSITKELYCFNSVHLNEFNIHTYTRAGGGTRSGGRGG
jgi:hypothetical protein